MAKRHQLDPRSWESVFGRMEELVLAGSGENAFGEVFKILIAQLATETTDAKALLGTSPIETARNVEHALYIAERRWPTILAGDEQSRLRSEQLHECVRVIDRVSLADSSMEVMDGVFEFLMSRNQKGSKGQFFTPRHVVEAMVRIVNPTSTDEVLDPACGSSGFLLHSIQHAREVGADGPPNVWGFDIDADAVQVSKAMMLIAGKPADAVMRLDSLITPSIGEALFSIGNIRHSTTIEDTIRLSRQSFEGFDAIITNPPFAGEIRDPSIIEAYELAEPNRRNERDVLFVERCINLLKPGGRLAIVLPTGRTGSKSNANLRSWLIRRLRVVSVLSLGRSTFQPHTSQKAEVIFGVKRPRAVPIDEAFSESILFMTSESPGKDNKGNVIERTSSKGSTLWERADHDLEDAVTLFDKYIAENNISWGARA